MNSKIETKPSKSERSGKSGERGAGSLSEIDTLLWRIKARLENESDQGQIIAMTSCSKGTGISTLLANLAVLAAKNHLGPVLLVDANMLAPRQHRIFRHKTSTGLADVMIGDVPPNEAIFPTNVESLDLMPSGAPSHLNSARVISENCEEMFQWARERYAMILVDLPQIDDLRHGLMIARQADMALVSVRSDFVSRTAAVQSVQRLISDGVKVAGTILSRQTTFTPKLLRT